MTTGERVSVLTAAAGADWELRVLELLGAGDPRLVLLKRCVDLRDLLATASTGQARVVVAAEDLPGLDADSVARLRRDGVATVVVAGSSGAADRARMIGAAAAPADSVEGLADRLVAAASETDREAPEPRAAHGRQLDGAARPPEETPPEPARADGRLLAVWGPTGAPGRTTVAVGVAAELARRGQDTLLVDADSHGGAVAQHLGVLDEVSGLLGASRLANAGGLDPARLATVARRVAPCLRVLTGLPRPDRWPEVREPAFVRLLEVARQSAALTALDLGFDLDQPGVALGSARNQMTLTGLAHADEVLVVGSADPVGLARLARGLVDLLGVIPGARARVVVNRARPSLGWGEKEVRAMVEGFLGPVGVHFLPDDRTATDRALAAGRSLVESGDSALRRALASLADDLVPAPERGGSRAIPTGRRGEVRSRRAGRAR